MSVNPSGALSRLLAGTGPANQVDDLEDRPAQEAPSPSTPPSPEEVAGQEVEESPAGEGGQEDVQAPKAVREAAKYRRQLRAAEGRVRDVEAQCDDLAGRLEQAQRRIAESHTGLRRPAALWAAGVEVRDLLDDSGDVDPGKVRQAVTKAAGELGLARNPRPDLHQAHTAGVDVAESFAGWLDRGRRRA
ncbi:hypothetical protein [Kineococcus sp. G2]|uniref:hypothetical protein n=1 Tax=Kineococcus sp. G2 TaxID=3127484 RepID=UPI00301BCCD0